MTNLIGTKPKALQFTLDEREWCKQQTCSTLKDEAQVSIAKNLIAQRGLEYTTDRWKNWDNYLAVYHAKRLVEDPATDAVLDAGACRDPSHPSAFLPSLSKLGFKDLQGCNLDEAQGPDLVDGGATYRHGNIEAYPYGDEQFAYIACLSTIEHGVNWQKFLQDTARILKPGGHLFVSFDYWPTPVNTHGQMAFGVPIKVFDKTDVMNMCVFGAQVGLLPVKAPIFEAGDPLVKWMGMEYTFFNMLLRRR